MIEPINHRLEFFEANSGLYGRISDLVLQIMQQDPDVSWVQMQGREVVDRSQPLAVPDIQAFYPDDEISAETAEVLANDLNDLFVYGAVVALEASKLEHSLDRLDIWERDMIEGVVENANSETPTNEDLGPLEPPLVDENLLVGLFQQLYFTDRDSGAEHKLVRTQLSIDDQVVLTSLGMTEFIEGDEQDLRVTEADGRYISGDLSRPPDGVGWATDWHQKFDPGLKTRMTVMNLVAGRFADDEELMDMLSTLNEYVLGSSMEDEAGPYIEALQFAAMNQKTGRQMGILMLAGLPTIQFLEQQASILEQHLASLSE